MTTTNLDALLAAVNDTPLDSDLRRVLADAYEESGDAGRADYCRRFAAVLDNPLNADLATRSRAAASTANGNLKRRTVSTAAALTCACRAIHESITDPSDAYYYVDGGGVANSYGYAASTALVLAVIRKDGKVCVDGGQATARKGGGSPANVWRELVAWKIGKPLAARLAAWAESR